MNFQNMHFTDSQQEVIDFIKNNEDKIIHMSIQDLAKKTYTSNATIIRICKKLGFKGYKDFKLSFIKEIESQKYIHQSIDFSSPFYQQESISQIKCILKKA